MTVSANSKSALRDAVLRKRLTLGADFRIAAGNAVAGRATALQVRPSHVVAGYMPIRGEIDPHPLMRALAKHGASLALPTIAADKQPLIFRAWQDGDLLGRGPLGIHEPVPNAAVAVPDIILVPLAAFDRRGHRIGYGAGHYDRVLARLRLEKSILAVGLAFALQEIPQVPNEPHDVPLDLVLTDKETIVIGSRNA